MILKKNKCHALSQEISHQPEADIEMTGRCFGFCHHTKCAHFSGGVGSEKWEDGECYWLLALGLWLKKRSALSGESEDGSGNTEAGRRKLGMKNASHGVCEAWYKVDDR